MSISSSFYTGLLVSVIPSVSPDKTWICQSPDRALVYNQVLQFVCTFLLYSFQGLLADLAGEPCHQNSSEMQTMQVHMKQSE